MRVAYLVQSLQMGACGTLHGVCCGNGGWLLPLLGLAPHMHHTLGREGHIVSRGIGNINRHT